MAFDPYRDGLGIASPARPVDHYTLLGLPLFESDPQRIAAAADARLRQLHALHGTAGVSWAAAILHEVAAAKVCLLTPSAKVGYDAALRAAVSSAGASFPDYPATPQAAAALLPPVALVGTTRVATAAPPPVARAVPLAEHESPRLDRRRWALWRTGGFVLVSAAILGWMLLGNGGSTDIARGPTNNGLDVDGPPTAESNPIDPSPPAAPEPAPPAESTTNRRPVIVRQESNGELHFTPATAKLLGDQKQVTAGTKATIEWTSAEGMEWDFHVLRPDVFQVVITYSAPRSWEGQEFKVAIDSEVKTVAVRAQGQVVTDQYFLPVRQNGDHRLRLALVQSPPDSSEPLIFQSLTMTPTKAKGR